jgi:hypothetical protein
MPFHKHSNFPFYVNEILLNEIHESRTNKVSSVLQTVQTEHEKADNILMA